jgi:hypothetical protein
MPQQIPTEINLKEDATIRMSLKGIWWIITTVFIAAVILVTTNASLNYKIERLSIQTTQQHETVIMKLNQMELTQRLYVLKQSFEEIMIMGIRYHDDHNFVTNKMTVDEEIEYRRKIREILNR